MQQTVLATKQRHSDLNMFKTTADTSTCCISMNRVAFAFPQIESLSVQIVGTELCEQISEEVWLPSDFVTFHAVLATGPASKS